MRKIRESSNKPLKIDGAKGKENEQNKNRVKTLESRPN